MNKNRKKIIGTLLGIMASVSSAGAMQNAPNTGSASTETVAKSKKRNQDTTSVYWNIAKLATSLLAVDEIGSNLPAIKYCTYPFLRQLSGYRVRRGVRGDFIRRNGPASLNYGYTIFNESDCNFYNISFSRGNMRYDKDKNSGKYFLKKDTFREISDDSFNNLKSDKKQSIGLLSAFYDIRLVMEDENGVVLSGSNATSVREFLKSDDFTPSDAADALSKVIEFVNIINSDKSDGDKIKLINKNMSAVFCPKGKLMESGHPIRILVKERKNAKGEIRRIFADFRIEDKKTKEEIEKEDAEKLEKEMEKLKKEMKKQAKK